MFKIKNKITKSKIKRMFLRAKEYYVLIQDIQNLGFKRNRDGINKDVFIHPRLSWVVKLVYGNDYFPNDAGFKEFYLWPEEAATKTFLDYGEVDLQFQAKVTRVGNYSVLGMLREELSKKRLKWLMDDHEGNCGMYKGKPVIIDF